MDPERILEFLPRVEAPPSAETRSFASIGYGDRTSPAATRLPHGKCVLARSSCRSKRKTRSAHYSVAFGITTAQCARSEQQRPGTILKLTPVQSRFVETPCVSLPTS